MHSVYSYKYIILLDTDTVSLLILVFLFNLAENRNIEVQYVWYEGDCNSNKNRLHHGRIFPGARGDKVPHEPVQ